MLIRAIDYVLVELMTTVNSDMWLRDISDPLGGGRHVYEIIQKYYKVQIII